MRTKWSKSYENNLLVAQSRSIAVIAQVVVMMGIPRWRMVQFDTRPVVEPQGGHVHVVQVGYLMVVVVELGGVWIVWAKLEEVGDEGEDEEEKFEDELFGCCYSHDGWEDEHQEDFD